MLLLFCLIAVVSAESYSRGYLRDMKQQEDKKLYQHYINEGVQQIENSVLLAAKDGQTQLSIYNPGCEEIIQNDKRITIERCEYIVKHIKDKITVKFPDSDLTFNEQTNEYKLDWS
jgi:uncharacterized membrane protein YfhO